MASTVRGFGVDIRIKDLFLDSRKILDRLAAGGKIALTEAGGYARKTARSLMPRRKPPKKRKDGTINPKRQATFDAPSAPGKPPKARSQDEFATLRNILYALHPSNESVIIGPVLLNQKQYHNGRLSRGTVPAVHEFGGTIGIREKRVGTTWVRIGRRRPRPGQPTRTRRATYPKRPFMNPALEATAPRFPALFTNQVRE